MKTILSLRMQKYLARISIFLILIALIAGMVGCAGSGYNPSSQNLEIYDWHDLDAIRNNLGGNHTLMNDLDSTTAGYTELASPAANEGKGWEPIGTPFGFFFSGSLEGNGYEIRDLFIMRPAEIDIGLFKGVDLVALINNVGVVNASVTGHSYVGSLAGGSFGTISNSYSTANVLGDDWVGGLVGYSMFGTVNSSYSTGSVTGERGVGGLVGVNDQATVHNSYSIANVTGNDYVGGLVGWNFKLDVESTVTESYSTGSVTGNGYVGGLVGDNTGTVSNSFWDIETSGQATSDGGTGKNTTEMQDITTFSGATWDIVGVENPSTRNPSYIWNIVNGVTYPFLSWQAETPGPATSIGPGELSYNAPRKLARGSDGVLHCVYSRFDGSYSQIYHSYSTDGGESWIEEQITDAPYRHGNPSIAVDSSDHIHVVWALRQGTPAGPDETCAIQYRVKTATWQDVEDVINNQSYPAVAVDSEDNVHLAVGGYWGRAYNGYYLKYIKRTSSGWGSPETVSSSLWANHPAIAIDQNDNVHLAYTHAPGCCCGLRYRERIASGWQGEEIIQTNDENWSAGSMAIDDDGNVYVVWYHPDTGSIKIKERTSSGWQITEDIYPAGEYSQGYPVITIDSNNYLHVVWQGKHSGSPDCYQIRYRKYTTNWSSVQDLTSASMNQEYPNLIWASWPIVSDTKTNTPKNGYAFVWNDGSYVKIYKSGDLEW